MTYINDSNFVNTVLSTIIQNVTNNSIKNQLQNYFTKNNQRVNYDLFLKFSRAIGTIRNSYKNDNLKFSDTFVLALLTYLHEAQYILSRNEDIVVLFVNEFFKKVPESERVTIECNEKFVCLSYLAQNLDMYVGTSDGININNKRNYNRSNRGRYQNYQNDGRRQRSRSRSTSKRVWGSHLTEKQRHDIEKQYNEVQPQPQQHQDYQNHVHVNADEMISRLVRDNHSLYACIKERDTTIFNLQNEVNRLRALTGGRNI